jgi:general secretion pathway protein K
VRNFGRTDLRRGSALLGVLWLSVALSAIAFTLSHTVRTELSRAALQMDSTRAYYLAKGGIERAMLRLLRIQRPDAEDADAGYRPGQQWMRFSFPAGDVEVQIVSESGKLNVNQATPEAITRVLTAAGIHPRLAGEMAARIEAARRPSRGQTLDPAMSVISNQDSSLSRRPASFKDLEEIFMLSGVTPELMFGAYRRGPDGLWMRTGGLHRHFSVLGSAQVDVNYASPEVLRAAGVSPAMIGSILEARSQRPIGREDAGIAQLTDAGSEIRLTAGGQSRAFTLWARARLRNGRAQRTVGALVQRRQSESGPPLRIVRWYDAEF